MTKTMRKHPRRRGLVGMVAMVVLLMTGCGGGDDSGPATTPTDTSAVGGSATPDEAGEMVFTFTGEPGEGGCRYDGPTTLANGETYPAQLENSSDDPVMVTFAELADGYDEQDFRDSLETPSGEYPAVASAEAHDPATNEWMQGTWQQMLLAEAGKTKKLRTGLTLTTPGQFVTFCWTDEGETAHVWPAGTLTIEE